MSDTPTKPDTKDLRARRGFMLGALAALPAATLLTACGDPADELGDDGELSQVERPLDKNRRGCAISPELARERLRRRALLDRHVGGENAHVLSSIMETFAPDAEMHFNGASFLDSDAIAAAHAGFGMSELPGGIAGLVVVEDRVYYTDDEILVRGRILGQHVGQIGPFPPSNLAVDLPYHAFYRFNQQGKLVSERVIMDWTPLARA